MVWHFIYRLVEAHAAEWSARGQPSHGVLTHSDGFWFLFAGFFPFFSFLSFNLEGTESSAPLQGLVHEWSKQYCGHVGKLSIWLGFAGLQGVILLVIYEYADDLWAVGKMFMNLKGFANFSTKACFVKKKVNCDFIIQPCLFSCITSLWSSICAFV